MQPCLMTKHSPFRHFKTSPEIIRLAVMIYVRFPLSVRMLRTCCANVRLIWQAKGGAVERWSNFHVTYATPPRCKTPFPNYTIIYCKTEGYICCICFGIFAPLAPPPPPNRGGKRVTEACSTAKLPSQPLVRYRRNRG